MHNAVAHLTIIHPDTVHTCVDLTQRREYERQMILQTNFNVDCINPVPWQLQNLYTG